MTFSYNDLLDPQKLFLLAGPCVVENKDLCFEVAEKVKEIYEESWASGCKGMTIYRDNCRTGVLISNDKKDNKKIRGRKTRRRTIQ